MIMSNLKNMVFVVLAPLIFAYRVVGPDALDVNPQSKPPGSAGIPKQAVPDDDAHLVPDDPVCTAAMIRLHMAPDDDGLALAGVMIGAPTESSPDDKLPVDLESGIKPSQSSKKCSRCSKVTLGGLAALLATGFGAALVIPGSNPVKELFNNNHGVKDEALPTTTTTTTPTPTTTTTTTTTEPKFECIRFIKAYRDGYVNLGHTMFVFGDLNNDSIALHNLYPADPETGEYKRIYPDPVRNINVPRYFKKVDLYKDVAKVVENECSQEYLVTASTDGYTAYCVGWEENFPKEDYQSSAGCTIDDSNTAGGPWCNIDDSNTASNIGSLNFTSFKEYIQGVRANGENSTHCLHSGIKV